MSIDYNEKREVYKLCRDKIRDKMHTSELNAAAIHAIATDWIKKHYPDVSLDVQELVGACLHWQRENKPLGKSIEINSEEVVIVEKELSLLEKFKEKESTALVKNFKSEIANAFEDGSCKCSRCKAADYDDTEFEYKHTLRIDDRKMKRVFIKSNNGTLCAHIKKIWSEIFGISLSGFSYEINKELLDAVTGHKEEFKFLLNPQEIQISGQAMYRIKVSEA
tara:strand:+ start:13818 stop:14480 length:663 start_codon:yes stop_codon:yes gene_type:complete